MEQHRTRIGEIVHYVAYNSQHLAAIIIGEDHSEHTVDLVLFTSMPNANGIKNFGTQFHQDVYYSREPFPGRWHYKEETKNEAY